VIWRAAAEANVCAGWAWVRGHLGHWRLLALAAVVALLLLYHESFLNSVWYEPVGRACLVALLARAGEC
jgi:hypothetical protein